MSDHENFMRGFRYVGTLEALSETAKQAGCMPCDKTTAALLDAIRQLTNKAVLSAWEYADQYRPAQSEGGSRP